MTRKTNTNLNIRVVGVDLHSDNFYATYDTIDGSVKTEIFPYTKESINRFLAVMKANHVKKAFIESTGSYYYPFASILEANGIETYVFNAFKTKNPDIDKRDDSDSAWLYALGKTGQVKASRLVSPNILPLREATRLRFHIADMIAASKKRIEGMLWRFGFLARNVSRRLEGKKFRGALKKALLGRVDRRFREDSLIVSIVERARSGLVGLDIILNELETLEYLMRRRDVVDEKIRKLAEPFMDKIEILMSMPGIRFTLAVAIFSEMGSIDRFPSGRHLASYAGLRPTLKQSGRKRRYGRTSKKSNSRLRRYMFLVAKSAMRSHDPIARRFVDRLRRRGKHFNVIAVALARKMLCIAWILLVRGVSWRNIRRIR